MTAPTPTDLPLAGALRAGTAEVHQRAEGSEFMTALFDGSLDADAFALLAVQQYHLYRALEAQVANAIEDGSTLLAAVDDPRLHRTAALQADLAHLLGEHWLEEADAHMVGATAHYCHEIALHGTDAEFLLAHHYVRYLGDLSGGLIIGRKVAQLYGVEEAGRSFYDFTEIKTAEKIKPFKDNYRQALNDLGVDAQAKERIVAFAVDAFELNRQVFIDLARTCGLVEKLEHVVDEGKDTVGHDFHRDRSK